MAEVFFYHMTRAPLEVTLPMLLGKARGAGWKIAVQGGAPDRLDWLDDKLWQGDGFLPHGVAGGEFDADQPVLLCAQGPYANTPDCVISVDGADLDIDEMARATRAMILFDGNDADAVAKARGQWKSVTGANLAAKYWSQESGRWEMKAEHSPT